jgi:hypothetical protein
MKYNFSFIQVINWLYVCRNNSLKLSDEIKEGKYNKEEIVNKLTIQKRNLLLVKDILDRKNKLQGINTEFLKNFKKIKKDYGVE